MSELTDFFGSGGSPFLKPIPAADLGNARPSAPIVAGFSTSSGRPEATGMPGPVGDGDYYEWDGGSITYYNSDVVAQWTLNTADLDAAAVYILGMRKSVGEDPEVAIYDSASATHRIRIVSFDSAGVVTGVTAWNNMPNNTSIPMQHGGAWFGKSVANYAGEWTLGTYGRVAIDPTGIPTAALPTAWDDTITAIDAGGGGVISLTGIPMKLVSGTSGLGVDSLGFEKNLRTGLNAVFGFGSEASARPLILEWNDYYWFGSGMAPRASLKTEFDVWLNDLVEALTLRSQTPLVAIT